MDYGPSGVGSWILDSDVVVVMRIPRVTTHYSILHYRTRNDNSRSVIGNGKINSSSAVQCSAGFGMT